jgi:hypothetical protein
VGVVIRTALNAFYDAAVWGLWLVGMGWLALLVFLPLLIKVGRRG